jgi:hypothetical protein
MENSKDSVSDLIFDDQKLIEMQFEKINQQQRDSRIKSMKKRKSTSKNKEPLPKQAKQRYGMQELEYNVKQTVQYLLWRNNMRHYNTVAFTQPCCNFKLMQFIRLIFLIALFVNALLFAFIFFKEALLFLNFWAICLSTVACI